MVQKIINMITNLLKEDIATAIEKVEQGYINAYEVYIQLKDLSKLINDCLSQIEDEAISEIGDESRQFAGYEIKKRSGSVRWDFSHIHSIKHLKSKIKHLERIHKLATDRAEKGLEPLVDSETGDFVEPAVKKYSKESLVVKKLK